MAKPATSCKQHGVDPVTYLRDVPTRIADTPVSQLAQFLPDRWKAARVVNPPAPANAVGGA